jgi:hypothetical protein
MMSDGDSNAYETIKNTYVPVDDDDEEENEDEDKENLLADAGKIQRKVTFRNFTTVVVMHFNFFRYS